MSCNNKQFFGETVENVQVIPQRPYINAKRYNKIYLIL